MKVKPRKVEEKDKIYYLDILYTSLASLKSKEEVKNFMRNLTTESERIMMARRIVIAKKLLEEKSYVEIMNEMGVGADTINKVHIWLGDKASGYEKAIIEVEKMFRARKRSERTFTGNAFDNLKRRYPLHFLLFNLFDKKHK